MPERIGKYHVLEQIGRGGMGTIFKAHDPVLDRLVAVKVISSEIDVTDERRARFFREAQACARLSHPNIVTVHDMGEDDGRLFLVMEFLEGQELRRLIRDRVPLELEDKLSFMIQVCDGLSYAHQRGVIHRDIKPGNIMRLRGGQVKILDFGIAQIASDDRSLTGTGRVMGTLRYIAPEQVQGRADHRSDIFSVGAVFYELVSGRPPFTGDNPLQILEQIRTAHPLPLDRVDPTVPISLAAAVDRAMQKDPAARFADLAEMRGQLERVQRRLTEESESARARARARDQRDELVSLQQALAERIGSSAVAVPEIGELERLAVVRERGREFASRIESVRARIARAEALAPALARAAESLQAEHVTDAVAELERIVADMPEHTRAHEMLRQARARAEDAEPVVAIPPFADTIGQLREAAERPLAAQEEARPAPPPAEEAREQTVQARPSAEARAGAQDAGLRAPASPPVAPADTPGGPSDPSPAASTSSPAESPRPAKVDRPATVGQRARALWRLGTGRRRALVVSGGVVALGGLIAIVLGVTAWLPRPSLVTPPSAAPSNTAAADRRLEPAKAGKGADGAVMVLVPAGAFRMGSNRTEIDRAIDGCKRKGSANRCRELLEHEGPDHAVVLDGFSIDRFEVTNALFERFVRATGHQTTAERERHGFVRKPSTGEFVKSEGAEWRKPNGFASAYVSDHPVAQVSWHDADAYCRFAGKRLPTEAEWEKAARGADGRIFPWGGSWDGSRLNANMVVRTPTAVGSYPNGVSPYGVHDMAGNVFEWVADWFDPGYYQGSPERNPKGPAAGSLRVNRGGAWWSAPERTRVSYRARSRPDSRSDALGFRCAKGL